MNECMKCWEALLPHTVRHPTVSRDLLAILGQYQSKYAGAMYSGCGGGYVYVVSETPVADSIRVTVRIAGNMTNSVVVSGGFDDLRSAQVRFLEEAARLGPLTCCSGPMRPLLGSKAGSQNFPRPSGNTFCGRFVTSRA